MFAHQGVNFCREGNYMKFNPNQYSYKNVIKNSDIESAGLEDVFSNALTQRSYLDVPAKRSLLHRVFSPLQVGQYVTAGIVRGLIPDNDISVSEGILGGIKASNPFGDGYAKGEHSYSKVFGDLGWNPTTFTGRAVRGTLGFVGDVLLDPATYLTLGGTALLKGSGKAVTKTGRVASVADDIAKGFGISMKGKVASELPKEVFNKVVKDYADDIYTNKDLILRLAQKKSDDVAKLLDTSTKGMTQDVAEGIVRNFNKSRGINITPDKIADEGRVLADKFNKVVGTQRKATDSTLSLGNVIGGKWLFGKSADKFATVAKAETIQKLGDATIAPYYAKLRHNIYGGKLGKLFSNTNSKLYELSKSNPEAFYDLMKLSEHTHDVTRNMRATKKIIYKRAKELNLSPSDAREAVKAMEDASIWSRNQKVTSLLDAKETKYIKDKLLVAKLDVDEQVKKILDIKSALSSKSTAIEGDLIKLYGDKASLPEKLLKGLEDIDLSKVTNKEDYVKLFDMFNEENIKAKDVLDNLRKNFTGDLKVVDDFVDSQLKTDRSYAFLKDDKLKQSLVDSGSDNAKFVQQFEYRKNRLYDKLLKTTNSSDLENVMSEIAQSKFSDDVLEYSSKSKVYNSSPDVITGKLFSSNDHYEAVAELTNKMFSATSDNLTTRQYRWANTVANEIDGLLKTFFKSNYNTLGYKQKELLYDLAINNATNKVNGKTVIGGIGQKERSAINEVIKKRLNNYKVNYLNDVLSTNSKVVVKNGDDVIHGFVGTISKSDKESTFKLLNKSGDYLGEFRYSDVQSVKIDSRFVNLDDLTKASKVTKNYIAKQNDYMKMLDEASAEIKKIDVDGVKSIGEFKKIYDSLSKDISENIVSLQKKLTDIDEKLIVNSDIEPLIKEYKALDDKLSSADAFESYLRTIYSGGDINKIKNNSISEISEIILNKNSGLNKTVSDVVQKLRNDLLQMGKSEISVGSLDVAKFNSISDRYLPHFLTDEGKKLFATSEQAKKIYVDGLQEFEFGGAYNPHALARSLTTISDEAGNTIINPNIIQLNDYLKRTFPNELQGKNAFVDDIAEIYTSRALKNTEIIYNKEYSKGLYDLFATPYDGNLGAGKKLTMLHDEFKQASSHYARLSTSLDMSDAVSAHLKSSDAKEAIAEKANKAIASIHGLSGHDLDMRVKRIHADAVSSEIRSFVAKNYDDIKRKELFSNSIQSFNKNVNPTNSLEDISVPIYVMSEENIGALRSVVYNYEKRYLDNIKDKIAKYHTNKFSETNLVPYDGEFYKSIIDRVETLDANDMISYVEKLYKEADEVDAERLKRFYDKLKYLNETKVAEPKQIGNHIIEKINTTENVVMQKDKGKLLDLYDKFTHLIKLNQTTVNPAFHVRNKFSNDFNNWLAIGSDVADIDFKKTVYNVFKNKGDVTDVLKVTSKDGSISTLNWADIYEEAQVLGVIDAGYFTKEMGDLSDKSVLFKGIPAKFNPTNAQQFKLYELGSKVGSNVEGYDRLVHFASQLSRGMSYQESAESVNKFLFDYSDVTAFEKNVMRRIFPYYTWFKKNSALQLEMLLEQPEKYRLVAKITGGIESMVDEEDRINKDFVNDFALDWIQTPFSVTNPEGRKETVLFNPALPYMDISGIPNPFDIKGSAKDMFARLNPMIKVPVELTTNRNVFFDSPIVKEGDNSIAKEVDHALSQFSYYNTGKDFASKTGTDLALEALNFGTGIKLLSYDYEKYKAMKIQELSKEQSSTSKKPNLLEEFGNTLADGFAGAISKAGSAVYNSLSDLADDVESSKPYGADEYTGALRPISQSKYNRLSDEDKALYTPPTPDTAMSYHNEAVRLSDEAYKEAGASKRFIWGLFDKVQIGKSKDEYAFGEVSRVIDGDTFEVTIGDKKKTVRLLLVDTPESVHPDMDVPMPYGVEASNYSKDYLLGKDTKIVFDGNKEDKYGRLLGYVEVNGGDYNKKLLDEGLAQIRYKYSPSYDRLHEYENAEDNAYNAKKGIWSVDGYATPKIDDNYNMKIEAIKRASGKRQITNK